MKKRTMQAEAYDVIAGRIGGDKVMLSFCTNGKTDFSVKISTTIALRLSKKLKEAAVPIQSWPGDTAESPG